MLIIIDEILAANNDFGSQDSRVSLIVQTAELTQLFLGDAILKRSNMVLPPPLTNDRFMKPKAYRQWPTTRA